MWQQSCKHRSNHEKLLRKATPAPARKKRILSPTKPCLSFAHQIPSTANVKRHINSKWYSCCNCDEADARMSNYTIRMRFEFKQEPTSAKTPRKQILIEDAERHLHCIGNHAKSIQRKGMNPTNSRDCSIAHRRQL